MGVGVRCVVRNVTSCLPSHPTVAMHMRCSCSCWPLPLCARVAGNGLGAEAAVALGPHPGQLVQLTWLNLDCKRRPGGWVLAGGVWCGMSRHVCLRTPHLPCTSACSCSCWPLPLCARVAANGLGAEGAAALGPHLGKLVQLTSLNLWGKRRPGGWVLASRV